ncbi:uncharacterized protein LOC131606033 [Vicia villosa]|uniref:uncharacterized protein LOC131606033 n=1 Tax=Vicia villosa TaxID=3911 RepID=UPI00273BF1F6|nr:uncharacterized protein LOC131606033 [Vicia villosa]
MVGDDLVDIEALAVNHSLVSNRVWEVVHSKESILCQKARSIWLKEGDSNTRFFHKVVKHSNRRNSVVGLNGITEEVDLAKLSLEDSMGLEVPFLEEEVRDVIWNSDGDKSPGLDGFNMGFYKICWPFLKKDILNFVNEFFECAILPKAVTASFLSLIPKHVSYFGKVVSVKNEEGDRMGFGERWRRWMEALVFNSSMLILVNESPTKDFVVSRGLHQGDPLSLFLFLLVAKGLTVLMNRASSLGDYVGFKVGHDVHFEILQFPHDTLLIGDGSWNNMWSAKAILRGFELVSGLRVNLSKIRFVGLKLEPCFIQAASTFLNCMVGSYSFSFLGIPVGFNHRRREVWRPVVSKLRKMLESLRFRHLSIVGGWCF